MVEREQAEASGEVREEAHVAARRCAGCGQSDAREALLRWVVSPEPEVGLAVVPDPKRKLPGRGVSTHPRPECLSAAARGGFSRSLRMNVRVSAPALIEAARAAYEQRCESLLLAASRAGKLAMGTEAVRDAMRQGRLELLVVASDAEGRREELERAAERLEARCSVLGTKESLGRLFGRVELGVAGILDRGIAAELGRLGAIAGELRRSEPRDDQQREARGRRGARGEHERGARHTEETAGEARDPAGSSRAAEVE